MFEQYFKDKVGPLTLRLAVGILCVHHGFLKIMAGGGTNWLSGVPTGWQAFLSWGEFVGGLLVLAGFWTRFGALLSFTVTLGGLIWLHGWRTLEQPYRTLEPVLLFALVSAALLFIGGGEWSLSSGSSNGRGTSRSAKQSKMAA